MKEKFDHHKFGKMKPDASFEDVSADLAKHEIIQEIINNAELISQNTVLDTFMLGTLFLKYFPTEDMLLDFPAISRDFFTHEYNHIDDYEINEYLYAPGIYYYPRYDYAAKILNIMLSMALQGNIYCIELFKNLYQTYYKKEYNQLKRFKTLNRAEIYAICKEYCPEQSDISFITEHLPRILIMSYFYEIELYSDCKIFYTLINRSEEPNELFMPEPFEGFPENIIAESNDFIDEQYLQMDEKKVKRMKEPILDEYNKGRAFIDKALEWLELPPYYLRFSSFECSGDKELLTRALELMKEMNPDTEYSFEDVQHNALILDCLCGISDLAIDYEEVLERILNLNHEKFDFENDHCKFKPEKIRVSESDKEKTAAAKRENLLQMMEKLTENAVEDDSENEILKDLDEARSLIRKQERELAHYKELAVRAENKLKELKAKQDSLKAEHAELIRLREHVSHLTEEEEPISETTLAEMTDYLKTKRIIIIGGHDNWIYKLRNQFRKWIFLSPEANNTIDSRVIEGADYIYFFTDHISHSTYNKYMKVIRDKGLPFGYIHSININGNIQQIYKDLV